MYRYLIGALALIGLTILLILILTSGGTRVPAPKAESLPSYANSNSQVSVDISGPIVAPENYNEANITVNKNNATFTLFQGYDYHVINYKVFSNSENSYQEFLYALYYAGYEKSIETNVPSNSGLCPSGDRYDFYLNNNGSVVSHTWATNCGSLPQSFGGSLGLTISLFEAQIPQLNDYTQNANF